MRQYVFKTIIFVLCSSGAAFGFQCNPSQSFTSLRNDRSLMFLSTSASPSTETITDMEIQTLFNLLSDSTILYDPSRGTCCRNRCSGCTYLDTDGNFLFDEYSSEDAEKGWIAPYVKVDFGERVQTSKWSSFLFSSADESTNEKKKELEREEFTTLLKQQLLSSNNNDDVSPLAIQALWNTLSPSAGYPRLTSTEIIRAIKGMDGAKSSEMGGAITFDVFARNLLAAAEQIQQLGGLSAVEDSNIVDYDAMSKEELLDMCVERGMKTNFPKMKRIIIEELRFFDANGRQGKRHPVKNTLS